MKEIPFEDLFFSKTNDFLHLYLTRQAGRSSKTEKSYSEGLSSFYDFIVHHKNLKVMKFRFSDCNYDLILEYMQYLKEERNLKPSSINQRIAALRSYLRFVADNSIDLIQIYMGVQKAPRQRVPKEQRPVLEKDALKSLLSAPPDSKIGRRDQMILILLFDTAVRVSELCSIVIGDVSLDVQTPVILIHGKGKKERSVVLNQKTVDHLRSYLALYHSGDVNKDTPLFYTVIHGKKGPMSSRNVERIVKKYGDQTRNAGVEVPDSIYPHMMRRSRATSLYRQDVPLEMVSAVLGHSSTETTKIYAIPSVEQLRQAMSKGQTEVAIADDSWDDKEEQMKQLFGLK